MRPLSRLLNMNGDMLSADSTLGPPSGRSVRLVSSGNLPALLSRQLHRRNPQALAGLRMVVCENLELLDASYELGVSMLLHATQQLPVRYVGISNSLNDPADLAGWFNVDPMALHSFRPGDRDQSLSISAQTFTIPQPTAFFKAMAKPAHTAIQGMPNQSALVFVPSRGHCHSVARDLITQCALEDVTARGYLNHNVEPDFLESQLGRIQDRSLVDVITHGIGFFHEGITKPDRTKILELYAEGIIRVLIVPHDSCWTLPVRAATVVVMGTQYLHAAAVGEERQLRDYTLEELVRMQGRAVRHNDLGHFHLFCQAEGKDTFMRFLTDGLPLESKLLDGGELRSWYEDQRRSGSIKTKQDGADALSFTFLAQRLQSNPAYYGAASSGTRSERLSRVVDDLHQDS